MRVKICGITQPEQGQAITELGATDLGFICVPSSPRYVSPEQIEAITRQLPPATGKIGVFVGTTPEEICRTVAIAHLTGVQLHGDESPEFCDQLRHLLPKIELIRAFRLKNPDSLAEIGAYCGVAHTILLDAYHPQQLGGTGQTLNWQALQQFSPPLPWLLAGGLTPDNLREALGQLQPDGIDLSSGVERSPGDKDLPQVARLFQELSQI
jgi:phosphoribosylanthranilate isomerase